MLLISERRIARLRNSLKRTLNSTCTIYRAPRVDDGQSGATQDYEPVATLRCRVGDISVPSASIGTTVGQQSVGLVQKIICFEWGADVRWDDRILVNGQTYTYVDTANEDTEEVFLRILAERMEAGVAL